MSREGRVLDRKKFDKNFRTMKQDVIVELQNTLGHPLLKGVGPAKSGIYALYFQDVLKYVGSAKRTIRQRLKEHIQRLDGRIALNDMTVRFLIFDDSEALYFEDVIIKHHKPEWNKSGFGNGDPGRNKRGASKWHKKFPLIDESETNEILTSQVKGQ